MITTDPMLMNRPEYDPILKVWTVRVTPYTAPRFFGTEKKAWAWLARKSAVANYSEAIKKLPGVN